MNTMKRWSLIVMGVLALPAYAAAQTLPTTPPSGYLDAVAANPKGVVTNITYGSNYAARVYTPPGYSKGQPYPYMFLMHGLGGSEASWHDNDLLAHIQLDNLIAQGLVDPFIIVFTKNDYNNWNFGDILINTLIPYVETNYCVSTDAKNRALGGLSMGGMQTINIGLPNADKFHYLMPSSPAPGIQGQSQLFPNAGALAKANLKLLFFTCGSGEVGAYGCNNVDTVSGYAETVGLGSIVKEFIVQGGAHNRVTWRPSFWNFAQLADQAGFTQAVTTRSMGCTGGGTTGTGGTNGGTGGSAGAGGRGGTGGAAAGSGGTSGGRGGGSAGGGSAGGGRTGQAGGPGVAGSGGTTAPGTGGAIAGSGGASPAGTGGTTPIGSGGQPAGTGGVVGSAGAGGGGAPTGTGGGGAPAGTADPAGCACALARGEAVSETASVALTVLMTAAAVMLFGARRGRRRDHQG